MKAFSKQILLLKHFKDSFGKSFLLIIHELLVHRSYRNRKGRNSIVRSKEKRVLGLVKWLDESIVTMLYEI